MPIFFQARASSILYQILRAQANSRTFILPANICPIVPLTFLKAGTPFEFADISAQTLCLDESETLQRLAQQPNKYGGVLYARTYGAQLAADDFFQRIKTVAPHVLVIDDCCLCVPQFEMPAASGSDLVLFSTGYAKIAELGYGGYAFAAHDIPYANEQLDYQAEALHLLTDSYKDAIAKHTRYVYHDTPWLDLQPPAISFDEFAVQARAQYKRAQTYRAQLNQLYTERLPVEIQLDAAYQNWRFHIRVPNKNELLHEIFAAGLFASSHYASLAGIFSDQPPAPNATHLAQQVVNLFSDHYFEMEQAMRVTEIIIKHIARFGTPETKTI